MMQKQAPTLSMPAGTDLQCLRHAADRPFQQSPLCVTALADRYGRQPKLPQRLLDPIRLHLQNGSNWRHLALGVAGWMRYTQGIDEQGQPIDVVDPQLAEINRSTGVIRAPNASPRCWP
jgi:fructuronate reductase